VKVYSVEGYSVDNSLVCLELFKTEEKALKMISEYSKEFPDIEYVTKEIEVQE